MPTLTPEVRVAAEAELAKITAALAEHDPFYTYRPSDGTLSEEKWAFLREVVKHEHLPPRLIGQRQIHEAIAPKIGVGGGNQSGKSLCCAIEDFIQATDEIPLAMRGWYPKAKRTTTWPQAIRVIGVDHKQLLNSVLPAYQQWVPRRFLKKGSWAESYSAERGVLTLTSPTTHKAISTLEFMTAQQEKESFGGNALTKLTIHEECPKEIYQENLLRFVTKDVRVQMAWTPIFGLSWSWQEFGVGAAQAGTVLFKLANVTNPTASVGALREIVKGLSYEEIRMRLLGEFVSLSGLVYGQLFDANVHVVDPFPIPSDWLILRGLDPHMAKPTACLWLALDREGQLYALDAYYENHDIAQVKADIAKKSDGYRLGWSVCDKSADSDHQLFRDMRGLCRNIYQELTRGDHPITPLWKSEKYTGSIVAGVDEIKQALKIHPVTGHPRLVIFKTPALQPLIEAFLSMERDAAVHEERTGLRDKIREGPHDLHACLRYLFQYPLRYVEPHPYVPELPQEGLVASY